MDATPQPELLVPRGGRKWQVGGSYQLTRVLKCFG